MLNNIAAVAFDVDGTLYPNYRFYLRVLPKALSRLRLLGAFAEARRRIRREGVATLSFYDLQARFCAELLGSGKKTPGTETVKALISRHIYGSWENLFFGIDPFPYVKECVSSFKKNGLKLAVLSDFPIGKKIEGLGLSGLWDAELSSEELGALKPHPLPFHRLAETLDLPPQRILYVGNSPAYDVAGAKNVGMMTALRCLFPRFPPGRRDLADTFVFNHYRQLQEYVLK
ncbi:MAG: HAD family hydrolase [Spirochaetaceae bacterium]|jgi:putative hydrolase of the HAD superfamily|nr:HAD family hydrolase [Spirochaetaceae bacterium]